MKVDQQTITPAQAAALLGKSTRYIHRLREGGYITPVTRGKYPLVAFLRGLMRYLQDMVEAAEPNASQAAVKDGRTRLTELQIRKKEQGLLPQEDLLNMVEDLVTTVEKHFTGMGDRVAVNPTIQADINAKVARSLITTRTAADVGLASIGENA